MSIPLSFTQKYAAANPTKAAFPVTLLTAAAFVAAVAHAVARDAESVSPTLRIDTLGGGHVTLGALPTAVALAAPPGVLAITAAQDGAGS